MSAGFSFREEDFEKSSRANEGRGDGEGSALYTSLPPTRNHPHNETPHLPNTTKNHKKLT